MSFIKFESAREKERIRNELRTAREELLNLAKMKAEDQADLKAQKILRGEQDWILPSIEKKLIKNSSKQKKTKKSKKKKAKNKKTKDYDDSSDNEELLRKKKSKKRRFSTESSSSSTSNSDKDVEWVEKNNSHTKVKEDAVREDWMTGGLLLPTYTNKHNDTKKDKEKQNIDSYDPKKSSRELNPYWKNGGTGLPDFQKPKEDYNDNGRSMHYTEKKYGSGNWRKKEFPQTSRDCNRQKLDDTDKNVQSGSKRRNDERKSNNSHRKHEYPYPQTQENDKHVRNRHRSPSKSQSPENKKLSSVEKLEKQSADNFLTDQQMNDLGAKIVKAEIMGDDELAKALEEKLEKARTVRNQIKSDSKKDFIKKLSEKTNHKKAEDEHVLLTRTDIKGASRPLSSARDVKSNDPWGGRKCKGKKVETHVDGERMRYFADDDRYNIKQMFEREKYSSAVDSDLAFAEIAGKHKNPNDDLEDIFEDKIRKKISEHKEAEKEKQRAIHEHETMSKVLDNCDKCFDSTKMEKQLLVSMGTTSYLSLPWHEGIQPGHCLIIPIQHVSCSTQLDEDSWAEITEYRKALTRMFAEKKQDVIFFETARYLHRRPHMIIHCVASSQFEMAPFYFKKAIQESEFEWSTNKQLISLKDKDLRRSIPKGLPYFWVHFGMDLGFAHVIEDQEQFPSSFAQEIIAGMLNLDAKKWRKPRKEYNSILKVKQMADWWKPFDFTN